MNMRFLSRINNYMKYGSRQIFDFGKKKTELGLCNLVQMGNVSSELYVPDNIIKPEYFNEPHQPTPVVGKPEIKNENDIIKMRKSCKIAANILKNCSRILKIGLTTDDIDKYVHQEIIAANAYPSPLRYCGFPKSICTSVNNVACHGIPDDRPLMDGDIINIDITVYFDGFHGDCSKTFLIGDVDERGKYLVDITKQSLDEAVRCCGPNQPINIIGKSVESYAQKYGLNVIPAFIGHGIGKYFHGPPDILHYSNDLGGFMEPGMTFTIEPILSLGDNFIEIQEDGWTAMTIDNSRSAQFEHTVLITESGVDVLTE